MKPRTGEIIVTLAQLSPNIRLVAGPKSFMLAVKTKAKGEVFYKTKYYYSDIGEALRGFMRYICKLPLEEHGKVPKIKRLLKRLDYLDKKISEVGSALTAEWETKYKPVAFANVPVPEAAKPCQENQ